MSVLCVRTTSGPAGASQAVRMGNLFFSSELLPIDPVSGRIECPYDVMGQANQVMANLESLLEANGLTLNDVAKCTLYLTEMEDFDVINLVYQQHFKKHHPARSTIQTAKLPQGARLMIDVVADFTDRDPGLTPALPGGNECRAFGCWRASFRCFALKRRRMPRDRKGHKSREPGVFRIATGERSSETPRSQRMSFNPALCGTLPSFCGVVSVLLAPFLFNLIAGRAPVFAESAPIIQKTENFDRDPGWEGFNNRMTSTVAPFKVTQHFGYSPDTHFTGGKKGEIGGTVTRASRLASYAAKIAPLTLNDAFSASGAFTFTETTSSAGIFVGFFNDAQPEVSRPTNSLGMDFDCEKSGARLAVRMISDKNKSCGEFVTRYIPGKDRPTPLKRGMRYDWTLHYDPKGNDGGGRFEYTLYGQSGNDPVKDKITVDVPKSGTRGRTTFTRFGMLNMRKAGHAATLYLDDLKVNDQSWDFSTDPGWIGVGNDVTYEDHERGGAQDFGWSPTNFAGGSKGEVGGTVWRGTPSFYACKTGPLSMADKLFARGRVAFTGADPDSGVYIGWFDNVGAMSKAGGERSMSNAIGILVEGPTRVGHYFRPFFATSDGIRASSKSGPILLPDSKPHQWTLLYDPAANSGDGAITVTLDDKTETMNLSRGAKAEGATLNHFGLFSGHNGGSKVKIWMDDVEYSDRLVTLRRYSCSDPGQATESPACIVTLRANGRNHRNFPSFLLSSFNTSFHLL